jgi:hypothetical protein
MKCTLKKKAGRFAANAMLPYKLPIHCGYMCFWEIYTYNKNINCKYYATQQ